MTEEVGVSPLLRLLPHLMLQAVFYSRHRFRFVLAPLDVVWGVVLVLLLFNRGLTLLAGFFYGSLHSSTSAGSAVLPLGAIPGDLVWLFRGSVHAPLSQGLSWSYRLRIASRTSACSAA